MPTKRQLEEQAAMERMELYFTAHPRSPAAVRRPKVSKRGRTWVALLGPNVQHGIAGFGTNVEMALRSFDVEYLRQLRPPVAA